MAARIHFDIIPGATGYIDTDYKAKADYTLRYIQDYDFVLTHINATDEEAHLHNYLGKIDAIEKIDRHIVGPILYELTKNFGDDFQIIVCGDHTTRCSDGKHTADPVPYALYGPSIKASHVQQFTESDCQDKELVSSITFFQDVICNKNFLKER
jgi:2,3-bisphosphoglycerate-independent phosphoglycerate mutase